MFRGSKRYIYNDLFQVADLVSKTLIKMERMGLYFQGLHGVGHSLGGQLIGHIGRAVINNSSPKLIMERISALDPAGN